MRSKERIERVRTFLLLIFFPWYPWLLPKPDWHQVVHFGNLGPFCESQAVLSLTNCCLYGHEMYVLFGTNSLVYQTILYVRFRSGSLIFQILYIWCGLLWCSCATICMFIAGGVIGFSGVLKTPRLDFWYFTGFVFDIYLNTLFFCVNIFWRTFLQAFLL